LFDCQSKKVEKHDKAQARPKTYRVLDVVASDKHLKKSRSYPRAARTRLRLTSTLYVYHEHTAH